MCNPRRLRTLFQQGAERYFTGAGAAPFVPDFTPFQVEIQPQLSLLQKTLLNVEGLGKELDPELDLWKTAQPYLERWVKEQIGWRGWLERFRLEMPQWSRTLPQLPRLAYQ